RTAWPSSASATTRRCSSTTPTSAASPGRGGRRSAASRPRNISRRKRAPRQCPRSPSSKDLAMRTSGILTIGGAFVAILGAAFSALMLKAFVVDKGQGFVDLSGLVVGVVVATIGLGLVAVGRKRARVEHETDDRHFSEVALALAKKN